MAQVPPFAPAFETQSREPANTPAANNVELRFIVVFLQSGPQFQQSPTEDRFSGLTSQCSSPWRKHELALFATTFG
jgi:hypothetical protein